MEIIGLLQKKSRKKDYALVPLLKIKGTKSIGKSPQFWQTSTT